MALPRTKVQLQNQWPAWFTGYAVTAGLDAETKANTHLEISREIAWMLINENLEQDLGRRIAKINAFIAAKIDPGTFDGYWVARFALLNWLLT